MNECEASDLMHGTGTFSKEWLLQAAPSKVRLSWRAKCARSFRFDDEFRRALDLMPRHHLSCVLERPRFCQKFDRCIDVVAYNGNSEENVPFNNDVGGPLHGSQAKQADIYTYCSLLGGERRISR